MYFQHGERVEFLCRCSFLEIYNEQIFDLLDPASTGLSLREDIKKGVFVDGLLERDVASARDAYRVCTFVQQQNYVLKLITKLVQV